MNEFSAEEYTRRRLKLRSYIGASMSVSVVLFALFIAPALSKHFAPTRLAGTFPAFESIALELVAEKKPTTAKPVATPVATPTPATLGRTGIVEVALHEHAKKPREYDSTVRMYTEGNREEWCADFVSYVYLKAEQPFTNSTTGSWRIPSVRSLGYYFQAQGRFHSARTYTPKPGDVAIYGSGHTNIVVAVENGMMTTIGGNEYNTVYKDTISHTYGTRGLTAFGSPLE